MLVSEARLAANRLNARKSTGPKTDEGKAISRRNGLKHGLAGEGVVVAEGDQAEVARRAEALTADLAPKSAVGSMMIVRMATLSVRAERAAGREAVAVANRARHAVDAFDEARVDAAERLFEALGASPRVNLRRLKKSPEGVDRLLDAWGELLDLLSLGTWSPEHLDRAASMTGTRAEVARASRLGALSMAAWGDPSRLVEADAAPQSDDARRAWALDRLAERVFAEIAELEEHRETLDFEAIELDRLDAPALSAVDASKEEVLAVRYEAAAQRGFFRALDEFRRAEAEAAARSEATAPAPAVPPAPRMASPGDPGPMAAREPAGTPPSPIFVDAPISRHPDGRPMVVNRPAWDPS